VEEHLAAAVVPDLHLVAELVAHLLGEGGEEAGGVEEASFGHLVKLTLFASPPSAFVIWAIFMIRMMGSFFFPGAS